MSDAGNPLPFPVLRQVGGVLCSALAAVAVGWVAFQLQQQENLPRFLFPLMYPLLVGAAAGGVCAAVMLTVTHSPQRIQILCAVFCGVMVVASQAWFSYRVYVSVIEGQLARNALIAAARQSTDDFGAQPFHHFVGAQIRRSNGWWLADAVLTIGSCMAVGGLIGGNGVAGKPD